MSRARFFYGASAGFGVGWLLMTFLNDGVVGWMVLGAAIALTFAVVFHRQSRRESRGRRWRRTASPYRG